VSNRWLDEHEASTPPTSSANRTKPARPANEASGAWSRRGFLTASASATGGLLLALSFGCKDKKAATPAPTEPTPPSAPAPGGPAAELNAWIRIDPDDTITMRISESEMGQGILTALAMILAEELDADWSKVRAEHAPADSARYGRQGTGGSSSVKQGWEPMKQAGAKARAMLVAAAADQLGVPAAELTTEESQVIHAATGRKLRYGELAAAAATKAPPESIDAAALKDPKRYRLVGKSTPRLDTPSKVTGDAVFGLDVRLPGMRYAMIARPPTLGGAVKAFDEKPALAVPGVVKVVAVPFGVAVIADNTWAAQKGRDALAVEWTPGPHPELSTSSVSRTLAAALEPKASVPSHDAKAEDDGKPGDAKARPARKTDAKAVAAELGRAKQKVTATYEAPYLAHATMEPLNCTVHVTGGGCKVWVGTQGPTGAQKAAAEALGVAPEKVEVTTAFLGGGFGRRSQSEFIGEAVHVARQVDYPVQVVWTRQDDMRAGYYRPAALASLEAGLDGDGWPTAWQQRIASPSILEKMGRLQDGVDGTSVEGVVDLPYALRALRVTYANPKLPLSTWFWRSVGSSQNAWMVECFVDELAKAGGKDPFELRQKLLADRPRHLAVLEKVAEAAHWGKPGRDGHARGIAMHESFGSFVAMVAEVSLKGGVPRVHKVWCAADCGKVVNPATVVAQMESGILYGLSAALHGKIELANGAITTGSFADNPVVRMPDCPEIETILVESTEAPGGVGEPSTPVIAPAVCNALYALTGKPVRTLPIKLEA
jgi:isoquinoline 1-oxidoreductase subunit beta